MSKSYELSIRYGSFDNLLDQHKSVPKAFRTWAVHFKNNAATCERLAKTLTGQNIDVITHLLEQTVQFIPKDDAAVQCLEAMVAKEMIDLVERHGETTCARCAGWGNLCDKCNDVPSNCTCGRKRLVLCSVCGAQRLVLGVL